MSAFTPIVQDTEFINNIKLANNQFTEDVIDNCIVLAQEKYLKLLLGDDLYLKFGGELPTPTREEYTELLNGVVYVDPNDSLSRNIDFVGIKKMLRYFTYYECVIDTMFSQTIIGKVSGVSANAAKVERGVLNDFAQSRYNEAVTLYGLAHDFICDIQDQEYNSTSITDNVDGTFTVAVASTKYLLNGDTVTIDGKDYVIQTVVTNTSFDILETIGTVFAAVTPIKFELFSTINHTEIEKLYFNGTF